MEGEAFQDHYPVEFANCFGCGRRNQAGLKIKSYWDGEETVCRFAPEPHQCGGAPGFACSGLVAMLIDCHGAATAAAAKLRDEGFALGDKPLARFTAASLKVEYLKPVPLEATLELRARVVEVKGREVAVSVTLYAEGEVCATGEERFVQLPGQWSVFTGYPKLID
jgi:acyl-coenzyme A thioesterase PaaI-like protein